MQRTTTLRGGLLLAAALIAGLVAAFYATRSSGAGAANKRVVMTAKNATLHKTILVNRRGMSLYALSVERRGRFICTDMACLSIWKPLTVAKGVSPAGVSGLGTVNRPDGKRQVAFHGAPLYSFSGDRKRGDVKGNGFKDVGVWHVVAAGKKSAAAAPAPAPANSSPYHY
jgi:predicted lipoprotein with Yx(FWY)xxD motif